MATTSSLASAAAKEAKKKSPSSSTTSSASSSTAAATNRTSTTTSKTSRGGATTQQQQHPASSSTAPGPANQTSSWIQRLYILIVQFIANMLSDILEQPRVQHALGDAVALGLSKALDDNQTPSRMSQICLAILEDETTDRMISRKMGQQMPRMAANFIGGAVSSGAVTSGGGGRGNKSKSKEGELEGEAIATESSSRDIISTQIMSKLMATTKKKDDDNDSTNKIKNKEV